jgi:hypothetical protein
MGRSALSRHLVTTKGNEPLRDLSAESVSFDQPQTISDHLDRLSAAWLRRITVALSVLVWGSVIWAVLRLFTRH